MQQSDRFVKVTALHRSENSVMNDAHITAYRIMSQRPVSKASVPGQKRPVPDSSRQTPPRRNVKVSSRNVLALRKDVELCEKATQDNIPSTASLPVINTQVRYKVPSPSIEPAVKVGTLEVATQFPDHRGNAKCGRSQTPHKSVASLVKALCRAEKTIVNYRDENAALRRIISENKFRMESSIGALRQINGSNISFTNPSENFTDISLNFSDDTGVLKRIMLPPERGKSLVLQSLHDIFQFSRNSEIKR